LLTKRLILLPLDKEIKKIELSENKDFYINFQKSILLSLMGKKQLTEWQFERCVEDLSRPQT
jgi:hypothetical protein